MRRPPELLIDQQPLESRKDKEVVNIFKNSASARVIESKLKKKDKSKAN